MSCHRCEFSFVNRGCQSDSPISILLPRHQGSWSCPFLLTSPSALFAFSFDRLDWRYPAPAWQWGHYDLSVPMVTTLEREVQPGHHIVRVSPLAIHYVGIEVVKLMNKDRALRRHLSSFQYYSIRCDVRGLVTNSLFMNSYLPYLQTTRQEQIKIGL